MADKYLYKIPIRYSDIDGMGNVHNAKYQEYFNEATLAFIKAHGIPADKLKKMGYVFPVKKVTIEYHKTLLYSDNPEVEVEISLASLKAASMTFELKILKDGEIVCNGTIKQGCFDLKQNKPVVIPGQLREALGR